jgi:alcohol-forming fatty acyl-CoA reductase
MENLNSVQKFFSGKTIFITGASGFMGKILLEKLLYSCSDVKEIIILMRDKREQLGSERVEQFKSLPVRIIEYWNFLTARHKDTSKSKEIFL